MNSRGKEGEQSCIASELVVLVTPDCNSMAEAIKLSVECVSDPGRLIVN